MTMARAGAVVGMSVAAVGLVLAVLVAAFFGLLGVAGKDEIALGIAAGIVALFVYAGVAGAVCARALRGAAWFLVACVFGVGAVLVPSGFGGLAAGLAAGDEVVRYVFGPMMMMGIVGSPVGLLLGVAWALVVRRQMSRAAAFG